MASTTQVKSSRFREEFDIDVFPYPASVYVAEQNEPVRKKQKTNRRFSRSTKEKMELTVNTISWLKSVWLGRENPTVDGEPNKTARVEEFDDEEISRMQKDTFGDFSDRSLSLPSEHNNSRLCVQYGPKNEILEVTAEPPRGFSWEGVERAKASAVRRKEAGAVKRKRWLEVDLPRPSISWDLMELDLSSWNDIPSTHSEATSKHDSTECDHVGNESVDRVHRV